MSAITENAFLPVDPKVTEGAACRNSSANFFPRRHESPRAALAVCATCPVRIQCLDEALRCGYRLSGIWGGTTQLQRKRMLSRYSRSA